MTHNISLSPGQLDLKTLRRVYEEPVTLSLHQRYEAAILNSVRVVTDLIQHNKIAYGVNTGFGLLANTRIPPDQLEQLQKSIILSHTAGIGNLLPDPVVRLVMVLKLNSLARGYSAVRPVLLKTIQALLGHQIYPCIPEKGSVGASGDLAPLAHMSLVLIGEGHARFKGNIISGGEALRIVKLEPITLAPKEGLALLNGTQVSTALALQGLFQAEDLLASAILTGSLTVEAAMGSHKPFDARIHAIRGHQGQMDCAQMFRDILQAETEISLSHQQCNKVQDPYSLRCQPQVMGACLTQIRQCADVLETEANAVSDNPLVFAEDNQILSGGNFHAEPVAFAADNMALAIAETGALSERRIALMMDSKLSGLPPFLVENSGLNSGFMIAQVTAAALASENKQLSHPASVDSLPTSANQEDHVSMATHAARRLDAMAANTRGILAIELLAACQGVDLRKPLKSSEKLEKLRTLVRKQVPFYAKDRCFSPDIQKIEALLTSRQLNRLMPLSFLPSS